jgi:hypothetical protein
MSTKCHKTYLFLYLIGYFVQILLEKHSKLTFSEFSQLVSASFGSPATEKLLI